MRTLCSLSPTARLLGTSFAVLLVSLRPAMAEQSNVAVSVPSGSLELLQSHCLDCHDGPDGEGGFDVGAVVADLSEPASYDTWVRIHDRIERGEMPPPDDAVIPLDELKKFLPATSNALNRAAREQRLRDGRVQGRRLTNGQLESTLQDLLKIDVPLSRLMPPETRSSGFVHLADAQTMSHFQLQSHLRVVDAALDTAFDRATLPVDEWSVDYGPEKIADKKPGRRNRDPELREGLAVIWSSGLIFYGRVSSTEVRRSGWYRITLTASALKPPPETDGVWCSVRSGECVSSAPLLDWIGDFRATSEPKTRTWDAWIPAGHMLEIRPADTTLRRGNFAGGQVGFGEGEKQDLPGVAMHRLQMQRIYPGGEVSEVRKRLFGGLSMRYDKAAKRSFPDLGQFDQQRIEEELVAQVRRFAPLAMRRPVPDEATAPYADFALATYRDQVAEGENGEHAFVHALRSGYRALLCSPRFLYLTEYADGEGRLDDWSIANRLSYFLCGSMPDEELFDAAAAGTLQDTKQRIDQTERLLASDRGRRFIQSFAAQWLDLVNIDFTEPDRRLFRDFDMVVQNAMLSETHLFLQDLLENDRPIRQLVDADYTYLNERLARYYELEPDEAERLETLDDELVRVALKPKSPRGGLLAHGSILKVTANGNDTSPVLRGIWVCERVLGDEIPPPPDNVPAVEPDIRGAKTIRDLLAKHESDTACAACHKAFDPPGFALENFDAGGKWRDHYRQLVGKKYKRGQIIDASHTMLEGGSFETFKEFRDLIARDDERLAANLASQLLVYATGAKVHFSDRPAIDAIVRQTESSDHGLRSILHAVIDSETFLSK